MRFYDGEKAKLREPAHSHTLSQNKCNRQVGSESVQGQYPKC